MGIETVPPSTTAVSMPRSSTPELSTGAPRWFTSNEDADFGSATVTEFQASAPAASHVHDALEGSEMVKPQCVESGSYASPLQISKFIHGSACNLCQADLSGAITMALCGHIFHDRCVRKWKSDSCPRCQEFLDKPTFQSLDSKGVPALPQGRMLMGLRWQPKLNGTYSNHQLHQFDRQMLGPAE